MQVAQIWTYPVKSLIGATVASTSLDASGIAGDRCWALRDVASGNLANCRQTPGIMQLAASARTDGGVDIMLPDGSSLTSGDAAVDDALSSALGRAVRLESLRPADDLDFFRRQPTEMDDPMAHLRGIFGREDDEPLPDFSKFGPAVLEFDSPPGTFHDCYPLMVMTTSALRSMAEAVPDSVIDVRRFRPSFVVDSGDEPGHPEFGWTGRRFRVGSAVIEVVNDCPRCAAITKQIDEHTPADRAILRHVVRDLGQAVGVYCTVSQPGTLAVGDEFVPID